MEAKQPKVLRKLNGWLRLHKCVNNAGKEEKKEKHSQQTSHSLTASRILLSSRRHMVSKEEKEGRKERYLQKEQDPPVVLFLVQTIILI